MRKIFGFISIMSLALLLFACVDVVEVEEVDSLELTGFELLEYFKTGETYSLQSALVTVKFTAESEKDDLVLSLNSSDLVVGGTGYDPQTKAINTEGTGDKSILIAYGGVSVELNFKIVQHLIDNSTADLQAVFTAALAAQAPREVYFNAGDYFLTSTIELTESISIFGPVHGTATITSPSNIFRVQQPGTTIKNMTLQLSSDVGAATGGIIDVTSTLAGDVTIENNTLRSLASGRILLDNYASQGISMLGGSNTRLLATNNLIYNVRNGINRLNGNVAHEITDNTIFHTKGGIMLNAQATEAGRSLITISNNSWTSTDPRYNSHNEWDIVNFNNGAIERRMTSLELTNMSETNQGAFVIDRTNHPSTVDLNRYVNNRTHLFVVDPDDEAGLTAFKAQVNPSVWYINSFTDGNEVDVTLFDSTTSGNMRDETHRRDQVIAGVTYGSYTLAQFYPGYDNLNEVPWWRGMSWRGGNYGGNFDFYWRPAESVEDALLQGSEEWVKIMVWTEVSGVWQFVEHQR